MSAHASRKLLDLGSVALVALGLAPAGAHALVPALLSVAAQAFVRRHEGRAFAASLLAFGALLAAGFRADWERPDAVSAALTFAGLLALLVAVVLGPSRGSAVAAALTASCRSRARLRTVGRAPALRPARRATPRRPSGTSS